MNTERSNSTLNTTPTPIDNVPLPNNVLTLQAMIRELLDALKKAQHEREGVQQRLDLLLRKLYGPKAERFNPEQPWLLPEMTAEIFVVWPQTCDVLESKRPSGSTRETAPPSRWNGSAKHRHHSHHLHPMLRLARNAVMMVTVVTMFFHPNLIPLMWTRR
jgi:hypothetical protein